MSGMPTDAPDRARPGHPAGHTVEAESGAAEAPECPFCGLPVTPEFVRTLELLLEAFGLVLEREPDDPLAAGFARFMARDKEERRGER